MAEEIPQRVEPILDADGNDAVLGKIDQLLNRHRPKPPAAETIPVLTDGPHVEDASIDDGIPVLTDVVTGPGRLAHPRPALSRSRSLDGALILQRMEIALDAELIRLLARIDRDDAEKARMLDQLVTGVKQALPGIVHAVIADKQSDSK